MNLKYIFLTLSTIALYKNSFFKVQSWKNLDNKILKNS